MGNQMKDRRLTLSEGVEHVAAIHKQKAEALQAERDRILDETQGTPMYDSPVAGRWRATLQKILREGEPRLVVFFNVVCDHCHTRLMDCEPWKYNTCTHKRQVGCPGCGWRGQGHYAALMAPATPGKKL